MYGFKRLITVLLILAISLMLIFGAQGLQTSASAKPVIIDTDMAADDWLAILFLLGRADVDVRAITVTGTGEAHCAPGVQNALNIVALAGKPDIPVTCGREMPLEGTRAFPDAWRQNVDSLSGISLPQSPRKPADKPAPELLIDLIRNSPDKVTLITLGPLTNVAEALTKSPDLIKNLTGIYIMGGAVDVPGNVASSNVGIDNKAAEWNLFVDPLATYQVIHSGAPIWLVSLDVTNQAPVTMAFYRRLEQDRETPLAEFAYQILTRNMDFLRSGGFFFWDTLTAAIAIEPSVATFTERRVTVITEDGPQVGATIASDKGAAIHVGRSANAEQFERLFLNALNGRAPDAITSGDKSPPAQSDTASTLAIVRRYYEEVWGKNNRDVLPELVAKSYISYFNGNDQGTDMSSLLDGITMLHTAMPDLKLTIVDLIGDGDRAATSIILSGTHTGAFVRLPPTGKPIRVAATAVLRLADGKIIEERMTLDLLTLLVETGGIPMELVGIAMGWSN